MKAVLGHETDAYSKLNELVNELTNVKEKIDKKIRDSANEIFDQKLSSFKKL